MKKISLFSPVILRIGISLVFLWFGISQISDPTSWLAYVPQSISDMTHVSIPAIVFLNGLFEIIFGSALLLGFKTRFVSFFLALHILDITYVVGFDSTGVRDFGITIASIAIWMNGMDWFSLDRFMKIEQPIQSQQ